ncbi:MAG: 4-hydroxythreonine-4-phosphate dehydrogenase PdxA [Candidatus Omnitrophica bacterium]|nr:4-hydroxythreonine-4-phosphate dehydrogenase PdxA [Candidatus Omnitrophota bacterium]MBU1933338.1 4-hydroxythreonine-4-phosphate dehydrogenase PdxA [Candidatus Omnitrophota bacterium]
MRKPLILVTTGDPKGIGPEVTEKALGDLRIRKMADFFVIRPTDATGLGAIKEAVSMLKKGRARALVTAPVTKSAIDRSGTPFKGHTEYLATLTKTRRFAMMFYSEPMKVAIVTRHLPLKEVAGSLTREKVETTIDLTDKALKKYFRIKRPRLVICGLNPHAGEQGLMGEEERKIIIPAVKRAKKTASGVKGPLPGDIAFYMAYHGMFDAVVAMYHDQGLAPFKMLAFNKGVNVTLGLPFIRTSPDHGTAYDIAGKGIADPGSMKEAMKLAARICAR